MHTGVHRGSVGGSRKGLARRVRDVAQRHSVHLGTSHVSVQRWLDGSGIQARTAGFLAEALSEKPRRRVTPADIGFSEAAPSTPVVGTRYAGSLTDALAVMDGLAQLAPEPEATDEPLPDSELNSAVLSWLVSRPDSLSPPDATARRVGMRDVAAMRTAARMFARLDFLYGGGHGHTALRHYFRHEVLPLLKANYSERVGRELFAVTAEIADLLAWTAYDTGNHALANRYFISALRMTQATGDRMMGGAILANMSHQAHYLGYGERAVRLARAAIEGGKNCTTPRARAVFAVHEARALSTLGDLKAASRALNEAEKHFERVDRADDPEWLLYFDEAELVGEHSHCFRDLKRPVESLRFAEKAVAQTDPQYARTLGFCRMVLAQSRLLNGDLEGAVATASLAADEGESLQSACFVRYVTDLQRVINDNAAVPVVAEFNEGVRQALAELEE